MGRDERPLDEPEDKVSNESVPSSVPCSDDEFAGIIGMGGMFSVGANSPFFIVVEVVRDFGEKRSLAFGADATRRINRGSAPIDLDDCKPIGRCADGGGRGLKEDCEGFAVWDPLCGDRPSAARCECFSDLVRVRDWAAETNSVESG